MNLVTAENEIVERLDTITGVQVKSWPDNPSDRIHDYSDNMVLVRYNGSVYEEPIPNNQPKVVQLRTIEWEIAVLARSFKEQGKHLGAYATIESIREVLTGYTLPSFDDASVIWPVGDVFTSEIRGFHIYTTTYQFTFPEAES